MRRFLMISAVATGLLAFTAAPHAGADSLDRLIAPASVCPGTANADAPAAVQREAMLCMTNFARRQSGLDKLSNTTKLDRSATFKSGDIIRCDSFSHEACGRDFTFWMERVGYIPTRCWRAGENIAWGTGSYSTVRSIFSSWMHSAGHRENILGSYDQIGIGLRVGGLEGYGGAHVWTQQFGLRC
jgi:uncharacterized protein YkwD